MGDKIRLMHRPGYFLIMLASLLILSACRTTATNRGEISGARTVEPVQVRVSATPEPTQAAVPLATITPTITPSPTLTPIPTPTAPPLLVNGDPRAAALGTPAAQAEGSCGLVDLFDFPLDPPDADDVAQGGSDFGIYRGRYNSYHAGEDWWLRRGGSSFGAPVYSIGHGRVTYAAPNNWGRDQGVVIIRHTYTDGETVLSFYGHLDPPSIVLTIGECVTRGQKIGEIGRPRTPPHLHFELRTHMPDETGTGYWGEDPTTAGWLPPSQTIWEKRLAASPGVLWTRPSAADGTRAIGVLDDETIVVIENDQLLGIDAENGTLRWQFRTPDEVRAAMIAPEGSMIYVVGQRGRLEAFRMNGISGEPATAPIWNIDLDIIGTPTIMPQPGGGLVLSIWQRLLAISADGELLWEDDSAGRLIDWSTTDNFLVISTAGGDTSLWLIDEARRSAWEQSISGKLTTDGELFWLYDAHGLYRLDPRSQTAGLVHELPRGISSLGDIMSVGDKMVLVTHADAVDRRLIALNGDGTLLWHFSYTASEALSGAIIFYVAGDQVYLLAEDLENSSKVSLFAIDSSQPVLFHLFTGGTRTALPSYTSMFAVGEDRLLLTIGGGHMILIDINQAWQAILVLGDQFADEASLTLP